MYTLDTVDTVDAAVLCSWSRMVRVGRSTSNQSGPSQVGPSYHQPMASRFAFVSLHE